MTTEDHRTLPLRGWDRSSRDARQTSVNAEPTLEGVFAPNGVDLTVIRWMLERSPEERLYAAQQLIDAAWTLRGDET